MTERNDWDGKKYTKEQAIDYIMNYGKHDETAKLDRRFWVSWWITDASGVFELHSPWWISGEIKRMADGAHSVCAAVVARDDDAARLVVQTSHDNPSVDLEWRFVEERPGDWSPFSARFQRAGWMKWPDGVT